MADSLTLMRITMRAGRLTGSTVNATGNMSATNPGRVEHD